MSLTRQIFREVAPLFRMLELPFGRTPPMYGARNWNRFDALRDLEVRPAIDVTEQGNKYVVDAELPGVSKENIEIRVGDGGRSITIEGQVIDKNSPESRISPKAPTAEDATEALPNAEQPTQLSVEREFSHNVRFTRTVWLPRSVDTDDVSAKLENGVLTIHAKKAEDKATTMVPIQ